MSTADTDIVLRLGRYFFKHHIGPIHARVKNRVLAVSVKFQIQIRITGYVRSSCYVGVIFEGLVEIIGVVITVHHLPHVGKRVEALIEGITDFRRARFAPFGSNDQNAVCPSDTVNGRRGSIFQNGDRLNFVWVNVIVVIYLNPIH